MINTMQVVKTVYLRTQKQEASSVSGATKKIIIKVVAFELAFRITELCSILRRLIRLLRR